MSGSINIMGVVGSILPATRPMRLHQVVNRTPQQGTCRLPSSAVCRELVSWGGDILVRRAAQAGARTWPELTHLYAASRVVLALGAVRRGDYAAVSAQLPWAALAPPSACLGTGNAARAAAGMGGPRAGQ